MMTPQKTAALAGKIERFLETLEAARYAPFNIAAPSEPEKEWAQCLPVTDDPQASEWLRRHGVQGAGLIGRYQCAALAVAPIVGFPESGLFEFGRNLRDASGCEKALIIPCYSSFYELTDLAAWCVKSSNRDIFLWRARAAALGEDCLESPVFAHRREPLPIFGSVLEYLQTERLGLFILDARKLWPQLLHCDLDLTATSPAAAKHFEGVLAFRQTVRPIAQADRRPNEKRSA